MPSAGQPAKVVRADMTSVSDAVGAVDAWEDACRAARSGPPFIGSALRHLSLMGTVKHGSILERGLPTEAVMRGNWNGHHGFCDAAAVQAAGEDTRQRLGSPNPYVLRG